MSDVREVHEWCSECDGTGVAGIGPEGVTYDCGNLDIHRALEALVNGAAEALRWLNTDNQDFYRVKRARAELERICGNSGRDA